MTGVLTTAQPSPHTFPDKLPAELDKDIEQSTQNQLIHIFSSTQITPPEFIPSDGSVSVIPSAISRRLYASPIAQDPLDNDYIVQKIKKSLHLLKPENPQTKSEDTIAESFYYSNTEPEFMPMLEATTTGVLSPKVLLASASLSILKTRTTLDSHQQLMYVDGGIPQQQSPRTISGQDQTGVTRIASSASPSLPTLSFGNRGDAVRVLQRLLQANGYTVRVDGVFGALTEAAIKAFQNQRSLSTDGVVGQRTWRELVR